MLDYTVLYYLINQQNSSRKGTCLVKIRGGINYVYLIQCVPLATETGISLIMLPLMRTLGALQTHTTNTFLFISHTTNVLLFKFRCNIFIGVRIIKEMPGSVASGTHCIINLSNTKRVCFI